MEEIRTVILCGGLGTRLGHLTKIKPKPMIEINKKPLIWHIIKLYYNKGFRNFILATGYKHSYISNFFKKLNNSKLDNIRIKIKKKSNEKVKKNEILVSLKFTGKKTLTGGRILRLKKILEKDENFMLTYGDGLSDIPINKLLKFHQKHKKIATVTAVNPPARFGALTVKNNTVKKFQEKIQTNEGWINGGFFVFNRKIFNFLKDDKTILEQDPMKNLVKRKQLIAFKHKGFWQCVDTVRDKEILEEKLKINE